MLEIILGVVGTALTGTTGWAIKAAYTLSTRVAILEKGQADALPLIDAKLDTITTFCEQIEKRLERVERKVLNGEYKADH